MDQTILLLVLVGATFLIGFMCGYATRAAISPYRRRHYGGR